jgi:hypothetical protein
MYRPGNKNMEDKENRRYESLEERKVRTYGLGMEDKENRRVRQIRK